MGSPPHETNSNHKNGTDLTQIRGIGAVRKRWLNALGIDTIAALAQASADDIEAQARRDGRTVSRDELDAWIAQAQVHPVEASSEPAKSSTVVEALTPVNGSNDLEQRREVEPDLALAGWDSFASFNVAYQTRQINGKTEQRLVVHHLEADAIEHWSALETDRLQPWMRDRVEASLSSVQATGSAIVATPLEAEITQLRVMQPHSMSRPMVADQNSPIFSGAIQTIEPFALEVSMQLTGLTEANQENQIAYRVQCLARNLTSGETDCLADVTAHDSLSNNSLSRVLLPSLQLHKSGTYRLKVLVTLQHAAAACFKVPMLHVV